MKATFEVDLSDAAQVAALIAFLQGNGAAAPAGKTTTAAKKTTTTANAAPAASSTSGVSDEERLEKLREKTTAKAKDDASRKKIRAKLTELSAEKISLLQPEHFDAYEKFIDAL